MCIKGLKHVSGSDYFFVVTVTGIKEKTKVFSKKKYPAENDSPLSAINLARIYAAKLKIDYPDQRVFVLSSDVEVTL